MRASPPNVSDAELRVHPLAIWVETRLGVSWSDVDQRWVRARPRTVTEAVGRSERGRPAATLPPAATALRDLLLISSVPERERTGAPHASARSFFAFKLHQFISGAGHAFATLEAPGERVGDGRGAAVPARATRRSASTRCTSAATAATSTTPFAS